MSTNAWILAGARTPIGKLLGVFKDFTAPELASVAIREALVRADVSAGQVDEVILGNVLQAGVGQAPARQAALKGGLPATVPAVTINKVCGSGLKAVMLASQAIRAGDAHIVVAGGMESMTRAPHLAMGSREGWKYGDVTLRDAMIVDGLWCGIENCAMGQHAEYTGRTCGVSRDDMDRFSLESQRRAAQAIAAKAFEDEIVPVKVRQRKEEILVSQDEGPRPETTLEGLARLKPAFDEKGTVTAGNSSMISDGAAALVVGDDEAARESPAPWKARIVASFTSGMEPRDLFVAPVLAVKGALRKAGLTTNDIDLFEINEAFAVQMVACVRQLEIDPAKVNVNGGAIALGHPIGASGARVLCTLLAALKARGLKRGLASLCLGGGNAVAMIVERP
ncbi:MAG: acetyl-CoA C-acetyltransferase [Planctomycetaceae bacterium]|nr:acetyl-CoA C-acetyltransferase [Planctomycetaceae bacterium]